MPRKTQPVVEHEEAEDRPQRKRKTQESQGANKLLIWGIAGVASLALLVGGIVLAMNAGGKKEDDRQAQGNPPSGPQPPHQPAKDGNPVKPPPVEEEEDPQQTPVIRVGDPRNPPPKDPAADLGPPVTPPALPEAENRPYLTLDPGGHTAMVQRTLFTPDSRRLVTVSSDKTVRVTDVASGETLHIFHLPVGPADEGALISAAMTQDGKKLAVSGMPLGRGKDGFPIYILSLETGNLERVLEGSEHLVTSMVFSRDGSNLFIGNAAGIPRLFNLLNGRSGTMMRHPDKVRCVAWSPNGQLVATGCDDKIVRLFKAESADLIAEMKGHATGILSLAFSPDSKTLASGCSINDGHIRIWNLNGTQRAAHMVRDQGDPLQITSLYFTPDGKEVLYTGIAYNGKAGLVNVANGTHRITITAHTNTVIAGQVAPNGQLAATAGGDDNEVLLWRVADGRIVHKLAGKGRAVLSTGWSSDGKTIAWGNTNRGSTTKGTLPLERTFRLDTLDFGPAPDATYVRRLGAAGGYTMEAVDFYSIAVKKDGKFVGTHKARTKEDRIYSFTPLPDGKRAIIGAAVSLYMIDLETGRVLRDFHGHTGNIFSVSPSPNGVHFLTGCTDQVMAIFHVDRPEPVMSLFMAGREWIAWTPEGYYAASAYGERLMGWLINNGIKRLASYFPAIRFRASLFQPDAMRYLSRAGSIQKALEVAAKARNRPTQQVTHLGNVLPPEVKITSPAGGPLEQAKVEVKATAKPAGNHPIQSMRLIVDGRPWKGLNEVRKFGNQPGEVQAGWQIELPPGTHELAVLADSAVSRGLSPVVEVVSSGEGLEQPNLYVLAMGISAYSGKLRLQYASADADAIAKVFQEKTAGIFKKVTVRQVKDRDATKKGMIEGLAWLKTVMTERDVAVVSFSGHGARDPLGNFYLVPVDVYPRNPKTLFEGELLKEALANLPGKVVCLLDACHSGSVAEDGPMLKPGGADDLVRDLINDEYGVVVMCSSMGSEYSLESPKTKSGFFTLGIIEGLSGKADLNGDSIVYIHELDQYAAMRVQQLSGGMQNPTTGRPPGIRTFPLSKP